MALDDHDGEQVLQRLEQATRRIAVALIVSAAIKSYDYSDAVNSGATRESILTDIVGFANEICAQTGI